MEKLEQKRVRCWLHKWTAWSNPFNSADTAWQQRTCIRCNFVDVRAL